MGHACALGTFKGSKGIQFFIVSIICILFSKAVYALPSVSNQKSFMVCEVALEFPGNEEDEEDNILIEARDENGRRVGSLSGYVTVDGSTLLHSYFSVEENWKKQGISRAFVAKLIKQQPQIRMIHAALILDNLDAYLLARYSRMSKREALKNTPFYKVFAPFGFTKIKIERSTFEEVELIVTLWR